MLKSGIYARNKKVPNIVSCLSSQLPSQVAGWEVLSFEVNLNHLIFAGKKNNNNNKPQSIIFVNGVKIQFNVPFLMGKNDCLVKKI